MSTVAYSALPRSAGRARQWMLDPVLLGATAVLLLIGCIMVTSASIAVASKGLGQPFYYLQRQLIFLSLGVVAYWVALNIPSTLWERLHKPLMVLAVLLLIVVLVPGLGHVVNGSRRWVRLGIMNFQVSELARLFMLVYVAGFIAQHQAALKQHFKAAAQPLIILGIAAGLLLREPDFGAASVLLATGVALLFLGGMRLRYFFILVAVAAIVMTLIAVASPYRIKRLIGFIDPWADPFDSGFQLTQSLIAIGRGELFGVGLGASVQKLFYLPEAHTDFVFAVLAEELGFIGVLATLMLYAMVVWRSLRVARMAAVAGMVFQAYVAAAFGVWIGLQAFINIGVNMGLLPTKGLTLPLLSAGGSGLLVTLVHLGMVLRIHHEASLSGRSALPKTTKKERAL